MANPFESFVQTELAKRPYAELDGAEEAIFIRRGPGPRQMEMLVIGEGQIVAKINGVLTGIALSGIGSGGMMHTHKQLDTALVAWTVTHGKGTRYFTCNVYDAAGKSVMPDEIQIVDSNTAIISFITPTKGHAVFSFDPLA